MTEHVERRLGAEAFEGVLEAARANAPWAYERIYDALAPTVAGYLRMRGAKEPEDLTHEVFLAVFRDLSRFDGDEAGFRAWVFTIAHHRLVDDRRRRAARPSTVELVPDRHGEVAGDVERAVLSDLELTGLARLLDELTDDQREVLLLRVVADLSVDDVAAILGKGPGAIKMLQNRALSALRVAIDRERVTS